jgi:phosphate:Na+ symporter
MDMMSGAMSPLRSSPMFVELMSNFSNPLLGILFGTVFTAIIQSSSAAVGIVQTLSEAGILPFGSAVFVLFGTNIGTCVTAVLSSMGANRNAKRATLIHLMFNMIGTIIFTAAVIAFPIADLVENAVADPMARIAAMHTLFNIVTTVMLLPLGNYLAKMAQVILPIMPEPVPDESVMHLAYLKPITAVGKGGGLGNSAVVVDQLRHELLRMMSMARENIVEGFDAVLARDVSRLEQVEEREEYLDFLNREIARNVSHLIALESNEEVSAAVSSFFTISGNLERIGDHADNLAGYTRILSAKNISFSETAQKQIAQMKVTCLEALDDLLKPGMGEVEFLSAVAQMEQKIDDMTDDFRRAQIQRMRDGLCDQEACIIYSELLTDFERIGDHVLNIAEELTKAHVALAE